MQAVDLSFSESSPNLTKVLAPAKNLERCAAVHCQENRQKECIGIVSVILFALSDFAGPDWGLFQSRAMCMAMNIFSLLLSNSARLPMNQACLPELLDITFDTILPG